MAWIEPFVSWLASHIPTKDDFNRIEGNILHLYVNKVTKVEGKNLSTNDYTTIEKDKLADIESGARKSMPASEILTELKTVDGPGSGLDADTLDGNNSSAFAPSSHASSDTTYGVGTTTNFGHCKTINNLTQASHVNGNALSAYQGKLLNDKISANAPTPLSVSGSIGIGSNVIDVLSFDININNYRRIIMDKYPKSNPDDSSSHILLDLIIMRGSPTTIAGMRHTVNASDSRNSFLLTSLTSVNQLIISNIYMRKVGDVGYIAIEQVATNYDYKIYVV